MKKKVSLWAPQTSRFCSDAQRGFGTAWVCCFCSELRHVGPTFPVCSRHLSGPPGAGQPSRELERAGPWTSWLRSFSGAEVWWNQKRVFISRGKREKSALWHLGTPGLAHAAPRSGPSMGTQLLGKPRTGTVTTWQPCAVRGSAYCDPEWC